MQIEEQTTAVQSTSSFKLANLKIIHQFNASRIPVFLVLDKIERKQYALKIYPFGPDNQPSISYQNESRFAGVCHPNLISFHRTFDQQKMALSQGKQSNVSLVLMEYAPFGDFSDILLEHRLLDPTLIRTFFIHLLDGLEYLHSHDVAHLDLKPENILLGDDCNLKIADFDMSYIKGDPKIRSKGTENFRAPELKESRCEDPFAADIYSLGLILFTMMFGGMPYVENKLINNEDLYECMQHDKEKFWRLHSTFQSPFPETSQEFKDLFMSMVHPDPSMRPTISQIRDHSWVKEPIYSNEDLESCFQELGIFRTEGV